MITFIATFELNLFTLLAVLLFPFIYFGYHFKYWYLPKRLKRIDLLLTVAVTALAAIIIIHMGLRFEDEEFNYQVLSFLHLLRLIQTLLITRQSKIILKPILEATGQNRKNKSDFNPAPQNKEIAELTWDDVVINDVLKEELITVIDLLRDPASAQNYGIEVPKGVLLAGPPGTGKTTIAKVIANTANLSFFVLRMDEIISKWVGESEKNLSKLFKMAMRYNPSVIFIDEVDSIGRTRASSSSAFSDSLLNHLLQLIDGVIETRGLYVIAATNRAELVDEALKRPGRLNKVIEVPLPDFEARKKLFAYYLSKSNVSQDINIGQLASVTEGSAGAQIKEICNQGALNSFKRESKDSNKERNFQVTTEDILSALQEFIGD